jgi:predicted DNA-binding protein (UPF0278 family)
MEIILKILAMIALLKGAFLLRFLYENYIPPGVKREVKIATEDEEEHFREIMEKFNENFKKKFPIRIFFAAILFLGGSIFLLFL